jgi:hypothetical protein
MASADNLCSSVARTASRWRSPAYGALEAARWRRAALVHDHNLPAQRARGPGAQSHAGHPQSPDFARRLDPKAGGHELLKPSPSEGLEAIPVSPRVNSPENDDPECIAPLVEPEPEARLL